MIHRWRTAQIALSPLAFAAPGHAQSILDKCTAETCKAQLTAPQLLDEVQILVKERRFDEARPMIKALATVPQYKFETRFLEGYVAAQTGDFRTAEAAFRAILVENPQQTRVRLELARVLYATHQTASADHQLRLAEQADDLPPEIARTVRQYRNLIRSQRAWTFNVDIGIAPDTNINNATSVDTVNVLFGSQPIPLTLDKAAKARSGIGETGSIEAGVRLPVAKALSLLIDADAYGTNYAGTAYDDFGFELASGPEFKLSDQTRVRIEAVGAQRLYGGRIASRQIGVKAGVDESIGKSQRVALQVDARSTEARFDPAYGGWSIGAYATYERVVHKSFIASATIFGRRDMLAADAYSNTEVGGNLGIGGELPKGFNIALGGGVSRAIYDAEIPLFSLEPRHDWRYNARATIGNRAIRVLGFSPSVNLTYARVDSSLSFYATSRTRVRFALARYF